MVCVALPGSDAVHRCQQHPPPPPASSCSLYASFAAKLIGEGRPQQSILLKHLHIGRKLVHYDITNQ
jgi:hypothetical protein